MRTFFRNPCGAIVVWTAIASIAWGIQAANAPADAKGAKNGLPNAQGSTLVVFKEKPSPESRKRDPLDWPMWRGPEQNGISRETGLIDNFNEATGENVLWRNEEAGGISTPVIMNGRLYTLARHEPRHGASKRKCCAWTRRPARSCGRAGTTFIYRACRPNAWAGRAWRPIRRPIAFMPKASTDIFNASTARRARKSGRARCTRSLAY